MDSEKNTSTAQSEGPYKNDISESMFTFALEGAKKMDIETIEMLKKIFENQDGKT